MSKKNNASNDNWETIKFVGGNIKLGNMGSFSKLYGDDVFITKYGEMRGTCSGHCDGCKKYCYVRKSYRYGSVINNHARNTRAFRTDLKRSFDDLHAQLSRKRKPFDVIRINQSGEIETTAELCCWVDLAARHPESRFYIYTKNFLAVFEMIAAIGADNIPDNFTILISVWHEYGVNEYKVLKNHSFIKAFVYCDGYDYSKHGIVFDGDCKAYNEAGKLDHNITCDKCKKCFNRSTKCISCNAH